MRLLSGLSRLSAAVLAAGCVAAFDPASDYECDNDGICLSSFIWCGGDATHGPSCSFPENVDPFTSNAPFAVLYHGESYNITWKHADPELPVLVEWQFEPFTSLNDTVQKSETPVMWSTSKSSHVVASPVPGASKTNSSSRKGS